MKLWLVVSICVSLILLLGVAPGCGPGAQGALPELVAISTYGVGAASYTYASLLVEEVEKKTGMKVKCVPVEEEVARFAVLLQGGVQYSWQPSGSWYNLSRGEGEYAKFDKPRLRSVWKGAPQYYTFAVRGNSNIMKLSDLKGKKLPWVPTPTIQKSMACLLAYAGLTWDDVVKVPTPTIQAGYTSLLNGTVDACTAPPSAPPIIELESSSYGLRWLAVDFNDKAAYARLKEVTPYYSWGLVTWGAGCSPQKPVGMIGGPATIGSVAGMTPDNVTYAFAKAIWDSYDVYKVKHVELSYYTHDIAVMVEDSCIPFDDGVVQFLKDIGQWNPDREAAQKKLLADEDARSGKK